MTESILIEGRVINWDPACCILKVQRSTGRQKYGTVLETCNMGQALYAYHCQQDNARILKKENGKWQKILLKKQRP